MIKVSILIPIYNTERFLSQCLDSVVNQTLKEIEIICINDGSTDQSSQIIKSYASNDNRIKVITKQNSGYGHSMNRGLALATGEYIGIVESDDYADEKMFEQLYKCAEKNSLDVVMSDYFTLETGSTPKRVSNFPNLSYNTLFNPEQQKEVFLCGGIWTGLYKNSFLNKNKILFNETPGASFQDTAFLLKVWLCANQAYLIDQAFLHYRLDNMDSSLNSIKKVFCICDEFEELSRFLDEKKQTKFESILFFKKYRCYKWNYNRLTVPYQYAFLVRMREELEYDIKKINQTNSNLYEFFSDKEKKEFKTLINDCNEFYDNTAKLNNNNSFTLSSRLIPRINKQAYKKGILSYLAEYDYIIIYGAGEIAKLVTDLLTTNNLYENIIGYAVTATKDNAPNLCNKPVKEINTYKEYTSNSLILIATYDRYQMDINRTLQEKGFENILSMNSETLKAMEQTLE